MLMGPDEVHRLIEQLQPIRDRAVDDKTAVAALYPFVDPEHEARITAFSKLINVLNSLQLSFTFLSKHLLHKPWWDAIGRTPIPDYDKQVYASEFANFVKVGFVHAMFSSIESSFRLFLRALDPAACNGGMAEFKSIYDCLLRSKLAAEPTDGINLLDLLRLVRNTIHNNGVYFNPRGADVTLSWQGETFEFRQGAPVDFVTWEFLIRVSDSLRILLRQVVEDTNLKKIAAMIDDPFSHVDCCITTVCSRHASRAAEPNS
ncbi:MAG: hypothetical protein ACPL7J_05795 [Desulfomonilaceae bacterium]